MTPSRNTSGRFGVSGVLGSQQSTSYLAPGFWESSWASFQGFASTLIGSDNSAVSSPNRSPTRRKNLDFRSGSRNTSAPPAQWGPSGSGDKRLASGTQEERRALVQAKKREALLAANGHVAPDAIGRYKRRGSEEEARDTGEEENREALVYLHQVKPQDTLAGVTIKYGCQPTVFRKANRLWPNDTIQIRRVVLMPVDACSVRGRKIPDPPNDKTLPTNHDQDSSIDEIMITPTAMNPHGKRYEEIPIPPPTQTPLSSIPTSPSISFALTNPEEPPWKHDSWVEIDGFSEPVEIARLSRKALGFFPRSRRKSQSFSDLDTPSASLDLPRASFQSAGGRGASPRRQTSIKSSQSRSSSVSQFAKRLQGPGGVGTMNSNVRKPGPAQDGLNKMFASHLPNMAPKSSFESLQQAVGMAQSQGHEASAAGLGVGAGPGGGGIENIGGAIEGWMRKVATKASNSLQPSTASSSSYTSEGGLRAGDLIELSEDAFEVGEDDDEDDARSSRTTAAAAAAAAAAVAPGGGGGESERGRANLITGWTAAQQEQMLHERFPPRGRVFADSSRRGRGRSK